MRTHHDGETHRISRLTPVPQVSERFPGETSPAHTPFRCIVLVCVGGAVGTAAREALFVVFAQGHGIPYTTFVINIVGALFLGALREALSVSGPDTGRRRSLQLLLGTGVMGGFTSYSAVAVESAGLLVHGQNWQVVVYGIATVLVGALATVAGIWVAQLVHRCRRSRLRAQHARCGFAGSGDTEGVG